MASYELREFRPRVATRAAIQFQLDRATDFLERTAICRLGCSVEAGCAHAADCEKRATAITTLCFGPCSITTCGVGAMRVVIEQVAAELRAIEPGEVPDPQRDFPFRLLVSRIDDAEVSLCDEVSRFAGNA